MRIPYSWLGELVEAPPVEETAELLNAIGLAVEKIHALPAAPDGVVVVDIIQIEPIEGSDHLLIAEVDDGKARHRVVCGAPNARAGMRTAFATIGTRLPAVELSVEKREVFGVVSEGMLCSPRELGLYEYGGGLIHFGEDAPLGASLAELWPAETVLELELTPNRADAFSLLGVARDLAARLDTALHHPAAGVRPADPTVDDGLTVIVEDPDGCSRFTLQRIDDVTIAPSPLWLQRRLAALGLRPRNTIVDVTNYVTFELGQPSHAYDREVIVDGTLVVRRARAGETVVTLNDETVSLDEADLLITTLDPSGAAGATTPIGIAGVIGGRDDSVRATTRHVALEVAHFDPVSIRATAKRHTLSTDAHHRFERGVDPNLPALASARAATLISEVAGGVVHAGFTAVGRDLPLTSITYRPSRVHFLMDIEVPAALQRRYLEALGFAVAPRSDDLWHVTAPSWRFDMAIEEDLIEEVARLYGYDHIGSTVPAMAFVPPITDPTHQHLKLLLAGFGFQETLTYSLTGDAELARAQAPSAEVRLLHPQGVERSVLRTALVPGLLGAAVLNRAAPSVALFEIGRVFSQGEHEHLGLLLSGHWVPDGWRPGIATDFFLLKGMLEKLAATRGADLELRACTASHLHPGVAAEVLWNGRSVGTAGRLHPSVEAAYGLDEVYVAELGMPLDGRPLAFRDYARQPYAERDLAVIAPEAVPYASLRTLVEGAAGDRLVSLEPFDVYHGEPIAAGSRSVALRLRFRHPERALTDGEVDGFMGNVMEAVRKAGYDIRR